MAATWIDEWDKERVVTATLSLSSDFTIRISSINVRYPGDYIMFAPRLGLFDERLEASKDIEAAKQEAIAIAKQQVNLIVKALRQEINLQPETPINDDKGNE